MEFTLTEAKGLQEKILKEIKKFQFGKKAQLAFLEDLYTLINDGIPANRAIEMLAQVSKGVSREVAFSLTNSISEGKPLAEGMSAWFVPNVVEIVRVGESGGALAQTLKSAINMLSQQGAVMGALIGAIAYPLFVIVMACCVMLYMDANILNQFRAIKPDNLWPAEGQQLVATAKMIRGWWWAFIAAVVATIIFFRQVFAKYVGELRPVLDKYPPFSLYKQLVAARLLETLGLLVANGVVFRAALEIMQNQANPYLASHLHAMQNLLSMGKTNIADVLATGLVKNDDLMRLRVMAEVKGFEHGLIRMGAKGTIDTNNTMKMIAKILGGILMAVGGILILIIVRGIYMTGMGLAN